jgi:cysteinyl-tRNA synthetase
VADVPDEIIARARHRDDARAAKDWSTADAIRDEIEAAGWVVEDTADGTQVRPA